MTRWNRVLLIFLILGLFMADFESLSFGSAPKPPVKLTTAKFVKVIDVDTIEVIINNKKEEIRIADVDYPDVKLYKKEIINFVQKNLQGKTLYLELTAKDKQGRFVVYIWLSPPNQINEQEIKTKLFNALLFMKGYAQLATNPVSIKYKSHFIKFQNEAKGKKLGIWKTLEVKELVRDKKQIIVYITETGGKYHRGNCKYLEKSRISISLEEAQKQGYKPCKICKPPE